MSEVSDQVIKLIQEIEDALVIVRQHSQQQLGITLRQADLELNLVKKTTLAAGGGVTLFVPVEASGEKTDANTQKFELSLTPVGGGLALGGIESNDLAKAIIDLAATMSQIATRNPARFALSGGSVTIAIETTKEGKLQVVWGGSLGRSSAHTIKLMFRPS